jgi:hypothetical protein
MKGKLSSVGNSIFIGEITFFIYSECILQNMYQINARKKLRPSCVSQFLTLYVAFFKFCAEVSLSNRFAPASASLSGATAEARVS